MATQQPAKKNTAFSFITALVDASDTTLFKSGPTLAAGDAKVSKDGGSLANLATLPSASGDMVTVALSSTEMNADRIVVIFSDQTATAQWCDQLIEIHTAGQQIDDLSTVTTAQVNTEADTALSDYDPPTKAEMDSGFSGLNDLTAAQVNAEVDTALSDYDPPTKAEMDSGFSGLNDLTAAQVNAEVDTALSDYDPPTKSELDSGLAALNDITVADVLAGVVDGSYTVSDSLRVALIGFLAKTTGSTTTAPKFRNLADSGDAITYTVDEDGNRTAVSEAI